MLTYTTESQSTATISTCKGEQQCSLITGEDQHCQGALTNSDYHVASPMYAMSGVGCIGTQLDTTSHQMRDREVYQQNLHNSPSNDDYSYPNLRVQWFQGHQYQYTADGYIIIEPDQHRQGSHVCTNAVNTDKCGSRGILDHTL